MATGTLASGSARRPQVLAAGVSAVAALIIVAAVQAAGLFNQPETPTARFTDRYSNLAGMGGLPNPGPRVTEDPWAESKDRFGNLAGMGGLFNPAPRD
jgi:hypothetical protein